MFAGRRSVTGETGAKRPTVNRVPGDEAKQGLIELQRGKIRILDPDRLRKRGR